VTENRTLAGPCAEDIERYRLHSPREIAAVLAELLARRSTLTVQLSEEHSAATALVALETARGEFVFDASNDEDLNRRLVAAPQLHFAGSLDQVRVYFSTGPVLPLRWQGLPAFRAPLPRSLARLQRREDYRVAPPLSRPLACRIPFPGAAAEYRLLDIGCGGLAVLLAPALAERLEPGLRVGPCSLDLPELGRIEFELELRNRLPNGAADGAWRAGFRFVDPTPPTERLVRCYVLAVERARRRLT